MMFPVASENPEPRGSIAVVAPSNNARWQSQLQCDLFLLEINVSTPFNHRMCLAVTLAINACSRTESSRVNFIYVSAAVARRALNADNDDEIFRVCRRCGRADFSHCRRAQQYKISLRTMLWLKCTRGAGTGTTEDPRRVSFHRVKRRYAHRMFAVPAAAVRHASPQAFAATLY